MNAKKGPNVSAEIAVIGAILMDIDVCDVVFEQLLPNMFEIETLGNVFRCVCDLRNCGKKIDIVTLIAALGSDYKKMLVQCAEQTPSLSNVPAYAAVVLEFWRRREMQKSLFEIVGGADADECADAVVKKIEDVVAYQREIVRGMRDETTLSIGESIDAFLSDMETRDAGLKSGWENFDALGLMEPDNAVVISARPGGGKTDFALNLAVKLSLHYNILFFTLEMSNKQLMRRVVSKATKINNERIRDKRCSEKELVSIRNVAEILRRNARLNIVDIAGITPELISAKILQYKPDAIFVDHIGLMQVENKKASTVEKLSEITHRLKASAKENHIVVFELIQLRRETNKQKGVKADLGDLKGSGTIEEDADAVLFLRRDAEQESDGEALRGDESYLMHVDVAKNRSGASDVTLNFMWQPQYSNFMRVEYAAREIPAVAQQEM